MANIEKTFADLIATAVGGTFAATTDWGVHIGKLPNKPNNCATVMLTGGLPPNPKWLVDYPSLQVIVRGEDYVATRAKAQAVKDALLGLPSQTISGDRIVSTKMNGDITPLGFDESNRALFSLNFSLITHPASGTNRTSL